MIYDVIVAEPKPYHHLIHSPLCMEEARLKQLGAFYPIRLGVFLRYFFSSIEDICKIIFLTKLRIGAVYIFLGYLRKRVFNFSFPTIFLRDRMSERLPKANI